MSGQGHNSPVALVTGAGSGIGRATAIKFAKAGCKVVVADLSSTKAHETCSMLQAAVLGAHCMSVQCDITVPDQVESLIQQIQETYGRLDYACNNAGVSGSVAAIHELSLEEWDRVMSVNVRGHFIAMKHQIPLMLTSSPRPAIVLISSVCGHRSHPAGMAAYTASKFAVRGLAMSAATEYGPRGLRVNTVSPGVIDTPLVADFYASEKGAATLPITAGTSSHTTPADTKQQPAGPHGGPSEVNLKLETDTTTAGESKPQTVGTVHKDVGDVNFDMFKTLPLRRIGNPDEVADAVVWLCMQGDYVTGTDLLVDGGILARATM